MIVNSNFLLSTILLIFYWGSVLPFDQRNNAMTEEVISALDRVLDFYERDYKSINLDGIFGLRVAQGELNIDQKVIFGLIDLFTNNECLSMQLCINNVFLLFTAGLHRIKINVKDLYVIRKYTYILTTFDFVVKDRETISQPTLCDTSKTRESIQWYIRIPPENLTNSAVFLLVFILASQSQSKRNNRDIHG